MSTNGTQPKPILAAEGVRKIYRSGADSVVALQGLDLVVPQGEFLAVMGPSGSGKTTRSARSIGRNRWGSSSRRST